VRKAARQRIARTRSPKPKGPQRDWAALPFTGFCDLLAVPLTLEQRVLCKVAFERIEPKDLPADEYAIAQILLKPSEQLEPVDEIPSAARAVLTLVKGARMGGTYLSALYAAHRALAADLSTLAPGEMARVIFGAPDLDLAEQALSYAVGAYDSHPELEGLKHPWSSKKRLVIERPNDGRKVEFVVRAASRGGKTFRGRSLICACLTEVAFFLTNDHVINDVDCFKAAVPRILPGGMCILESTPFAEAGLLFDEYERNHGHPVTSLAMVAPTLLMLPTERNKEVIAVAEATDPDNAAREFGCQFIPFGSSLFFPRDLLRKMKVPGAGKKAAPGPGEGAGIGGDLGLSRDAAICVAVHRIPALQLATDKPEDERRNPKTDRYRVEETLERRPARGAPLQLKALVPLFCDLARRHGQKSVLVDQWSILPAREHLGDEKTGTKGFSLDVETAVDEAEIYEATLELMKEFRVEVPTEFEPLLRQLALVMSKPKPGGGKTIILPRKFGVHCDLVPAFVKAVWRAKRSHVGPLNFEQPKTGARKAKRTGGY